MPSSTQIVSSFIEGAPPGELQDVVTDIKTLTSDEPNVVASLGPAFQKYNEEQFTTVKLPGASSSVIVSKYNRLDDGRYFDVESSSSFEFDHTTQKASNVQSYSLDSQNADLIKSLIKSFAAYTSEHFTSSSYGIYPTDSDTTITICTVSNLYKASNFYNGRWRSFYTITPNSSNIEGHIAVTVHYYEDGNVNFSSKRDLSLSAASGSATAIVKEIATAEKAYQEALNSSFAGLDKGAFKALRRTLPISAMKIDWNKVGSYNLAHDMQGGGR